MYNFKKTAVSHQPSAIRKTKSNGSRPIETRIEISGANPLNTNEAAQGGGGGLDIAEVRRSRDHIALAHRAARCMHVKPNGLRCGSPALKGNVWCHFHYQYYNAPWENTFPPLEDGNGVQAALMYVLERLRMEAFRGGEINVPIVKALLYGLQTASYNLRHTNFAPVLESPITCDSTRVPDEEVALVGPKKPVSRS